MSDAITRLTAALEGHYQIEREIGAGGMATVYLARDLKHNRSVALKVLKSELSAVVGAERFLAEIETTANLQQPHILPLYDSGEADGLLFYVMPYVEGETLQARIDREKQLPVDEAVRIATAVANALDYAHRHGVVHRDMKPANVLLQDGEPVVADFGIALAIGMAGGSRLTETGLSLGTPYYMSPEQATGDQSVDARSDIYALSAVLYEMLTGEPPYTGTTAQAVLGRILQGAPVSATAVRSSVPANVDATIQKGLERLPADRFTHAHDFAEALADPAFRHREAAEGVTAGPGPWKSLALASIGVIAALAVALGWSMTRTTPEQVVRFAIRLEPHMGISDAGVNLALSPDGSRLVFTGPSDLWQRPLNQMEITPVAFDGEARNPVVSPDGNSLAFTDRGALTTVSLLGGPPFTVVPAGIGAGNGLDWSSNGNIYFGARDGTIHEVPSSGGESRRITSVTPGTVHRWPDALPDGRGVLLTIAVPDGGLDENQIGVIEFGSGEDPTPLVPGTMARYATSGHLVYTMPDGTLMGAPFDLERLEVTGPPVAMLREVGVSNNSRAQFALSESGTLVYRFGGQGARVIPVWVERDGGSREIDPTWSVLGNPSYSSISLSPDGTRLAISKIDAEGVWDLWVKQLDTGPESRLTFEGSFNRRASWLSDGETLAFMSNRGGAYDLWTRRADGSGAASLVLDPQISLNEAVYSPDGEWLVMRHTEDDIFAMRVGVDSVPEPLIATEFTERYIALSPDGRWLAHVTDQSGQEEVYVVPFPDVTSGRVQVSVGGGTEPVWAHSGRELFYRSGANELVAAAVSLEPTFRVGEQTALFSMEDYLTANGYRQYVVSPDDQRFLMLELGEDVDTELFIVENFFEELRERASN